MPHQITKLFMHPINNIIIFFICSSILLPLTSYNEACGSKTEKPKTQKQQIIGTTNISESWRLFLPHEMFMLHKEKSQVFWNSDVTIWITEFNNKQSKISLLTEMKKRLPPQAKITIDENNEFYHLLVFEQSSSTDSKGHKQPLTINAHAIADDSFLLLSITCKKPEVTPAIYTLLRSLEYKMVTPHEEAGK